MLRVGTAAPVGWLLHGGQVALLLSPHCVLDRYSSAWLAVGLLVWIELCSKLVPCGPRGRQRSLRHDSTQVGIERLLVSVLRGAAYPLLRHDAVQTHVLDGHLRRGAVVPQLRFRRRLRQLVALTSRRLKRPYCVSAFGTRQHALEV